MQERRDIYSVTSVSGRADWAGGPIMWAMKHSKNNNSWEYWINSVKCDQVICDMEEFHKKPWKSEWGRNWRLYFKGDGWEKHSGRWGKAQGVEQGAPLPTKT